MTNFTRLAALAILSAGVLAIDITHELNSGWRMGLMPRQTTQDLQTFSGSLGGARAPSILNSGNSERPFMVDGDTFTDFQSASNRACDNQKNACADLSNSGRANFEVSSCDKQNEQCKATLSSARLTSFDSVGSAPPALVTSDANFEFFCEF